MKQDIVFPQVTEIENSSIVHYTIKGEERMTLLHPIDEIFNETCVPEYRLGFVTRDGETYFGKYPTIVEGENGEYYVKIKSAINKLYSMNIPAKDLIGYFEIIDKDDI